MTPTETSYPTQTTVRPDSNGPSRTTASSLTSDTDPLGPALEALELRRPEETVGLARARLQTNPADASAFAVLGVALCQMGETAAALQALERAHYLNPHDARILYNYGLVLEAAGRPTAARIRFFAALKLSPQYTRAREHLIRLNVEPFGGAAGEAKKPATAPPLLNPTLERFREDEFQSSWTDGTLPSGLSESAWSGIPPAASPVLLRDTPDSGAAVYPGRSDLLKEDPLAGQTERAKAPLPAGSQPERAGRRGIGGLVLAPVLAVGLIVGAVGYAVRRPNPSSSAKQVALASVAPVLGKTGEPEKDEPVKYKGPGGPSYRRAQMANADLRDKSLAKADFEGADLSCARLIRADLRGASFVHASLPGTDCRNASLVRANLLGVLLRDSDLRGADLRGAYMKAADLSHSNLSGAWLEKATLSRAELRQSLLPGAQLPGASLRNAALHRANLRNANLKGVDLQNSDLSGADLRGANLDAAKLQGARYDRNTQWPDGLEPAERGAKRVLPAQR